MNRISGISITLLILLFSSSVFSGCSDQEAAKGSKLVLVSFDGFRHDYLLKTETPNFDKLVEDGVVGDGLIPIFPSKTFPNHYAIATGLYPGNSGFIGNVMYDSTMQARFTMRNRDAVENPDWYGGEPIWNTVEKNGKKAGTMFWVGSEAPIQDMRPTHWKSYEESMPDSARIDTVIKWLTYGNEQEVDFATLYFHFPDKQGHRYGPDSKEVEENVRYIDDLVGYLIERLDEMGINSKTNVLLVSDHGMTKVSREKVIILDEMIDPDDLDIIEYSPALMANAPNGNLYEVYEAIASNADHFKVYRKSEIPDRYHLKNHYRVPELLMVADLGYTITTQDYFESRENYPSGGAHGFDNKERDMHALFVANGPDFKEGYKIHSFQNIHLYKLMAYLMNVEPVQNDGSIDSVNVMLK